MSGLTTPRRLGLCAFLASLALLFSFPQTCFACSCLPPKPPAAALADAHAVFQGQITKVERVEDHNGFGSQQATVRVTRVWKGAVGTETTIYTGSGSADCGYSFRPSEEYIIYAYATTNAAGQPGSSLTTNSCARTAPVSRAADDLNALGPGQPPIPGLPNTGAGATIAMPLAWPVGAALVVGLVVLLLGLVARHAPKDA